MKFVIGDIPRFAFWFANPNHAAVDGSPIDFAYTKYGQLAGKYLGGKEKPDASVEYEYSKSGQIVARTANGVRQTYEYDGRGQLLAVKEGDADVERYAYDKAGNMLKKTIRGKTTTFAFDGANQLVSSTTDGVTTKYAYDAAGRLVEEGDRTYRYGYLDKVLSVTEGERKYTYDYHVDGQLARTDYGNGKSEDFGWDGLALIKRGDERFVNEPHVGGGNPVASSKGTTYFNDMLGTTVGAKHGRKYTPAALTAFGETIENGSVRSTPTPSDYTSFFTGKPHVAGLGHTFLFRNYRAGLAKWQTADPLGYPDGWNQLAYCGNGVMGVVDVCGCWVEAVHHDINKTWLSEVIGSQKLNSYEWGMFNLSVLNIMNSASDWTDDIFAGNQNDERAYMHAMRSKDQTVEDAELNWMYYMYQCQSNALQLAEFARQAYRRHDYISAVSCINSAIDWMGCLVHTFVDETAPPHHGFQHFSWWTSIQHRSGETFSVYEDKGCRDTIKRRLNDWYLLTLREVLRQPE